MKKIAGLLGIMFFFYFVIQIIFQFLIKSYDITYQINQDYQFDVREKYTYHVKGETNNYYFEIVVNGKMFQIQTFEAMKKSSKIIKEIKHFKNANYECVLPIFKNGKIVTDILCEKEGLYYYYNNLKGKDPELDQFASKNKMNEYENKKDVISENDQVFVYNNQLKNHYIVLENYKGIFTFHTKNKFKNIQLFETETYTKDISALVGSYYIVADYDQEYDFHEFYVVQLKNNTVSKIVSNTEISHNSYIQGVVGNSVYILDKSNKKQFQIDVKNKHVTQIGNETKGVKVYADGEFVDRNFYEALNNKLTFNDYSTDNQLNGISYARVDKVGGNLSGYYYLYEKVGQMYRVYRANVQNPTQRIMLFQTDNIDNIAYSKNYIYYNDGSEIHYFSEVTGVKTIVSYQDLEFNKQLKLFVYTK